MEKIEHFKLTGRFGMSTEIETGNMNLPFWTEELANKLYEWEEGLDGKNIAGVLIDIILKQSEIIDSLNKVIDKLNHDNLPTQKRANQL